ncbi:MULTISPECIES: hypothetical protein [unclassified Streptomyces]|uniref:hypothetical protein n=1 Tax=unclassified Streptomyces TaxID=2593676 RepID=UPI0038154CF4
MRNDHASSRPAWVGDLVKDEDGRIAIVTDVAAGAVWILRPVGCLFADLWTTTDPDSLFVLMTRAQRVASR